MDLRGEPYIIVLVPEERYNPNYGDDRICKCDHPYYRHFDWMMDNAPVGCKYCMCYKFVEKDEQTTDTR